MVQEVNFYKEFFYKRQHSQELLELMLGSSCLYKTLCINALSAMDSISENHKHLEVKNNFLFCVRVERERKVEPGSCALTAQELCQVKRVLEQDKHWQEPVKGNNGEKERKKT